MKIIDALSRAGRELQKARITSHLLDSRILLGYCLNLSLERIIFNPDLVLSQNQIHDFFSLIKRRAAREPVSHIIGKREFFGNNFFVNALVLDPRPDSECLIETVLRHFSDRAKKIKILELGVGSGCLILTLLTIFKNARAIGVDISKKALEIARKNSNFHNLNERCEFIESDWFSSLNPTQKFDLIISNPPYIETNQIGFLQDEVKKYEPLIALDGGSDGLNCYRKIAENAVNFLNSTAIIIVEIGQNQENAVTGIFIASGLEFIEDRKDLNGIIRCLVFRKK